MWQPWREVIRDEFLFTSWWWIFYFEYFHISLCVTKRHFEHTKTNWRTSWIKTFFSNHQTFSSYKKSRMVSKLFFHYTWEFFFFILKWYNLFENVPSRSKMFLHIFKSFVWSLDLTKNQKLSRGEKKGLFSPRDEVNGIIRQDLFRLVS